MPLATPDDSSFKSKLDVGGRLEIDLLHVHPGIVRIGMPLQTADKKIVAERARQTRKQRDIKRLRAVNLKGIDVLGVVAVHEGATNRGSKPVVALAERYFVVQDTVRQVRFHNTECVGGRDRPRGDGCLHRVAGKGYLIDVGQARDQRRRVAHSTRGMLIFAARVQAEAAKLRAPAHTIDGVEARLVRTSVIVDQRLSKVKAIPQRQT